MLSLRTRRVWSILAIPLLLLGSHLAAAQGKDADKAAKARADIDKEQAAVLADFKKLKGAEAVYNKAAGYATFTVTKGGFGASGAGGGGAAVDKKTGAKTYMRMGSAGVGLTFGLSRYDIIILFETPEKFNAFVKGGWDSAATAQAAAGHSGAEVSSTFFDGVAYYQIGRKGLMASADVSGTKFWVADELNPK